MKYRYVLEHVFANSNEFMEWIIGRCLDVVIKSFQMLISTECK